MKQEIHTIMQTKYPQAQATIEVFFVKSL